MQHFTSLPIYGDLFASSTQAFLESERKLPPSFDVYNHTINQNFEEMDQGEDGDLDDRYYYYMTSLRVRGRTGMLSQGLECS